MFQLESTEEKDFVKLNIDGSRISSVNSSTIGGIIGDDKCKVKFLFVKKLGDVDIIVPSR